MKKRHRKLFLEETTNYKMLEDFNLKLGGYCCKDFRKLSKTHGHKIERDPKGNEYIWTFINEKRMLGIGMRWKYCPFCGKRLDKGI